MSEFVNPHIKSCRANETLKLDIDRDPTETMYEFREDSNPDACPYITDAFRCKLDRLISMGSINTGCDNSWGALWIDVDTGKITAQDGRDEIHIALDVCNTRQDVIQLWERYVKLCENSTFVAADPAFIDLLVWDNLCSRDEGPADLMWKQARTGLRNVGEYHDSQYLSECRCEKDSGCNNYD